MKKSHVPADKSIDLYVNYSMFNEKGFLVIEDEICMRANEKQYNRIKDSYDSGKFKNMNEDESLSDLCELYANEIRKAKWQRFTFEYPQDIVNGITFEENSQSQWNPEEFLKVVNSVIENSMDELNAEIDKELDEYYEHIDEIETQDKALRELNEWVRANGLECGIRDYGLMDKAGDCVGTLDMAWEFGIYGLQRGFTKPLAISIAYYSTQELVEKAKEMGFTCFSSIEEFKAYVEKVYMK